MSDRVRRGASEAGRVPSLRISLHQLRRGPLERAASFFRSPLLPLVSVSSPSMCV